MSRLNRFRLCLGQGTGRNGRVALWDLSRYSASRAFTPREKLVLYLAVAMTRTPPDVSDELFGELRKHFTSAARRAGHGDRAANRRDRFNTTFRCRVAGYSGDAYCPLPEGK